MNILVTTGGSRGDVQPLLALAQALHAAGHRVLLAAPPENRAWAARCGCDFAAFGGRFDTVLDRLGAAHTPGAALAFLRFVRSDIDRQFDRLTSLPADFDLVLGASLSFATASFAEKTGTTYGFIGFCPQILPSKTHPPPTVPFLPSTGGLNRLFWLVDRLMDHAVLRPLINRRRRRMNLPPVSASLPHMLGRRVILACDPALAPVPADVAPQVQQTGAWPLVPQKRLPPAVENFLAKGPPPVYMGFGSMPHRDTAALLPELKKACRAAARRLFVTVGPSVPPRCDDGLCLHSGDLPHAVLFDRMAAVVHHGGAGTTATAARAGVPQVIVPHVLDQFYWADRVSALGLGPKPLRRTRLTARRLRAAIAEVVEIDRYRRRARETARQIESVDPLRAAVDVIERMPGSA